MKFLQRNTKGFLPIPKLLPKLQKEEERLRKLWRMESDKVEAIYDDLKKKERAEEERARQQKIQDDSESNNTEEEAK